MKNLKFRFVATLLALCIFSVVVFLFSSCNQEEIVINQDAVAIKAQLSKIPEPSKEEFQIFLSESSGMKKAPADESQQLVLVEIFPLNSSTYEVFDSGAIKYFVYYEINSNGYREKFLTLSQEFEIIDGKIDEKNYTLGVSISCPFARNFYFESNDGIEDLTYFFRFDDGEQFAYRSNYNGNVKLPPIDGGQWQLKVTYFDGDLRQEFMTPMISFNSNSNMIDLQYQIREENTLSFVSLNKELIKGSYIIQFLSENENGEYMNYSIPVAYDEGLEKIISFNLPMVNLKRVIICGMNGCLYYGVKLHSTNINGIKKYVLIEN